MNGILRPLLRLAPSLGPRAAFARVPALVPSLAFARGHPRFDGHAAGSGKLNGARGPAASTEGAGGRTGPDFSSNSSRGGGKGGPRSGSSGNGNNNRPPLPDFRTLAIYGFGAAVLTSFLIAQSSFTPEPISWQEFSSQYLSKDLVDKIYIINKTHGRAILKGGAEKPVVAFSVGSVDSFDAALAAEHKENVPVYYHSAVSLSQAAFALLPTLLVIGGLYYLTRRGMQQGAQNGLFNMGKSTAKRFNQEKDVKIKFADVAGADEAKKEIMEFVEFLKFPKKFEKLGAKIPRGAILSGPPGTGKTMLAKATAGEAGVPFFSVSGSEFVEMFVGVGASRVRDLFATARREAPSIVFIDEIDAIGRARSQSGQFGGGHDEREATLNQVLVEMDGFSTSDHVVVLAGTNRPDVLDAALLRPGRFSRHITVDKPDISGRKDVYRVYLKRIRLDEADELDTLANKLAALTPGFSGADIANCVNEAALIAARENSESVAWHHFERAVERVSFGIENKGKIMSTQEKRIIAYHEAGHAVASWYLKHADPLVKVTIIPRGQALGYARYLPADVPMPTVGELLDRMVTALGGRVSEEINLASVSSGASSDFQRVTQIATNMVAQWGMSPRVGYVNYDEGEGYYTKPFSNETAKVIDEEVRKLVDESYRRCRDLLTEKKEQVRVIAEALLSRETLERRDFVTLIGERPYPDNSIEFRYLKGEGVLDNLGKPQPDASANQANKETKSGSNGDDDSRNASPDGKTSGKSDKNDEKDSS